MIVVSKGDVDGPTQPVSSTRFCTDGKQIAGTSEGSLRCDTKGTINCGTSSALTSPSTDDSHDNLQPHDILDTSIQTNGTEFERERETACGRSVDGVEGRARNNSCNPLSSIAELQTLIQASSTNYAGASASKFGTNSKAATTMSMGLQSSIINSRKSLGTLTKGHILAGTSEVTKLSAKPSNLSVKP